MRQVPTALLEALNNDPVEPRVAVLIENDNGDIWITSHDDIDTPEGEALFSAALVAASVASQEIVPERGFSTIGSERIGLVDDGFTDYLRKLREDFNDTIYENKTTIFYGTAGLPFEDYLVYAPHYVAKVISDQNEYTITLDDAQREERKTIFADKPKAVCRSNLGFGSGDLVMNVLDLDRFELVEHGDGWEDAPNQTVGYLKASGVDSNGQQATEWMRYTGKGIETIDGIDFAKFTGVTRGVLGTTVINIIGGQASGNTEVEEMIYLDLPAPKLALAVLTGSLFGQAGASLPAHWHAGITAGFINTSSFELIGPDLWDPTTDEGLRFAFYDLEEENAKDWLAQQIFRLCNLFIRIDEAGELELVRFSAAPQDSPGSVVLNYENLTAVSKLERDNTGIRNRFLINWEWRPDLERFVRSDIYVDSDSIARNNITSDAYTLNMKGIRNSSRDVRTSLQSLAEGIRARFSDPIIKPRVSALLYDCIGLQVGDVVTLDLQKHPDYNAEDTVLMSCEVQSIEFDFLAGTCSMTLFGTAGRPTPIDFTAGADVAQINHGAGWTAIDTVLTGVVSGETFTVTSSGDLPPGKYFYDGNITIADGVTVTFNGDVVVIDCRDLTLVNTAKLDGKGRGKVNARGYFGGGDAAQEGTDYTTTTKGLVFTTRYARYKRGSFSGAVPNRIRPAVTQVGNFQGIRVDDQGEVIGLPSLLAGSSGGMSGRARHNDTGFISPAINGGNGGAGLCIIAENLFTGLASRIDTSGDDNEAGGDITINNFGSNRALRPSSGFGWPGALLVLIKDRASPLPILDGVHIASTGAFSESRTVDRRPYANGSWRETRLSNFSVVGSRLTGAEKFASTNFGNAARRVRYIASDVAAPINTGVDRTGAAELPTALQISQRINTPNTPAADQVTLTLTATPPTDAFYSHALFQYRLQGQEQWFDAEYKIANETTVQVTADGSDYEFLARSVSVTGQVSNAGVQESFTVFDVKAQPAQDVPELSLPDIFGLRLINRVPNTLDQFKSGNAEFAWQARSQTISTEFGDDRLGADGGQYDPFFDDFRIRVLVNGANKWEDSTRQPNYVLTLEENRLRNIGREFTFEVLARGANGQIGKPERIAVSNPAPAAPAVSVETGITSLRASFERPDDIDFIGFDFYIIEGSGDPFAATPERLSGTSVTKDGLMPDTQYTIGVRSVDEFGPGDQTTPITVSTNKLSANDVTGLGEWATLLDQADLDFIAANVAENAIPSEQIAFLVAGKIAAGAIAVQVDVGEDSNRVLLDGATGVVQTVNSGFTVTMGAHVVDGVTYVLSGNDGLIPTFGFLPNGGVDIGNGGVVYDPATDTTTFSGELVAASGTFAGELSAATGVFGDVPSGQFIEFSGGVLQFGPNATIGSNEDTTLTVGPTGDYSSINQALEALSRVVPAYKAGGFTAEILVLADHIESESIDVSGVDLSFITIRSQAASGIEVDIASGDPFLSVTNGGISPVIRSSVNQQFYSSAFPGRIFFADTGGEIIIQGNVSVNNNATSNGTNPVYLIHGSKLRNIGSLDSIFTITGGGLWVSLGSAMSVYTMIINSIDRALPLVVTGRSSVTANSVTTNDPISDQAILVEQSSRVDSSFITTNGGTTQVRWGSELISSNTITVNSYTTRGILIQEGASMMGRNVVDADGSGFAVQIIGAGQAIANSISGTTDPAKNSISIGRLVLTP